MSFYTESASIENDVFVDESPAEATPDYIQAEEAILDEENIPLEQLLDDGFGDRLSDEEILNEIDIKSFESIHGVSVESILERQRGNIQ